MIITQPKEDIAHFVSGIIGERQHFPFENYSAIGLIKDDELVAGVIYNHATGSNIMAHIAAVEGKKWLTREFLFAMFDYPFNQLGVRRITGLVPKKNTVARRFDTHLGFKYEGNMRNALPDDDMIIYGMLREKCKWLDLK
jgi:RimJ/RimL family protein N-acetyltransferase|tara:strand:- start:8856 stop:9275 length:420 start_codon:yes stop_codon:yes gene_type:complete